MRDIWAIGPTTATYHLRLHGFAPREAERLVALKIRHDRGEFREISPDDRLRFGRYLVRNGWFNEDGPTRQSHARRSVEELIREIEQLVGRSRTRGVRTEETPA